MKNLHTQKKRKETDFLLQATYMPAQRKPLYILKRGGSSRFVNLIILQAEVRFGVILLHDKKRRQVALQQEQPHLQFYSDNIMIINLADGNWKTHFKTEWFIKSIPSLSMRTGVTKCQMATWWLRRWFFSTNWKAIKDFLLNKREKNISTILFWCMSK